MSRGKRSLVAALVLVCGGALVGCDGGGSGGALEPGPSGSAPSATPPTLGDDELTVLEKGDPIGAVRGGGGAPTGLLTTEDRIVITSADDTIRVLDRETRELVWEKDFTEKRRGWVYPGGICTEPVIGPDGATIAFGLTIEIDCARVAVVDLETGRLRSAKSLVETRYAGYDVTFYYAINSLVVAGGTLWWQGHEDIGYVDPGGQPRLVLTRRDLGVKEDADQIYALTQSADNLLVANVGRGSPGSARYADRWLGIEVTGTTAEVAWTTRDEPADIGRRDLASPTEIEVFRDFPGSPAVAGLKGNRLAIGRLDAATGELRTAAVIKWRYLSLFEPDYASSWAVDGDVLYVAAGPPPDEQTEVMAIDLAAGRVLWRTDVTPPSGLARGELPRIEQVVQGTDGDAYALVTGNGLLGAEIQRFDAGTGELTGTWELPERLDATRYVPAVVDDTVILRLRSVEDSGPTTYLLGVAEN